MKANIVKLLLFIALSTIFLFCKSSLGPVFLTYKNLGRLQEIYPDIPKKQNYIVYKFVQNNHIFKENLMGELIFLEKTYKENQTIVSKISFLLKNISFARNKSIRLRSYQGTVYYDNKTKILDLHSENCYTYGKKDFRDRLYPLEGWTCDHLIWRFKNEFSYLIPLEDVDLQNKNEERTKYTKWMFLSYPLLYNYRDFKEPVWFGSFLAETEEDYIFYGYNADVYLDRNDSIKIFNNPLNIHIKEVVGDFVFIDKSILKDLFITNDTIIYFPIVNKSLF